MLGQLQGQGSFPHGRPRGDDDEVAGLEAGGHIVEVIEGGLPPGRHAFVLVALLDSVEFFVEEGAQGIKKLTHPSLADLNRFGEALALLRSFPARDNVASPFELRLWYVSGDILERSGRPAEAREEFRRIVRHDPQAFDAAERLARLG